MADYYDEEVLRDYADKTVQIAESYKDARIAYGNALIKMKIELVKAFKSKEIKDTIAEDKAYLLLVGNKPELQDVFEQMILKEQEYKGLEKVLNARTQNTSQEQSFIKNRIQSGA
ncbi:MAG: hypothetical protein WC516_06095 [Patescibacteria group bacterium]|jgi:hypothetical protein